MQAALDLAGAGFSVVLADSSPAIGGVMSRLDKTFPTNDCAMCIMSPKLVDAGRHLDISVLTGAELEELTGGPGDFRARMRVRARGVDLAKCTACGDCSAACPVEVPSAFDVGLAPRKAIYQLYPQAVPNAYAIDKRGTSPCRLACPSGVNVQGFVALTGAGKFGAAWELIREALPFPIVCGTVCHRPCEQACQRGELDEPLAVARLKRFLGEYATAHPDIETAAADKVSPLDGAAPPQVAVIGSGPAGLACAYHLARAGIKAEVFEALPVPGGMMRVGIPAYRLPRHLVEHEIALVTGLGVEIRCEQALGRDFSLDDLFGRGYKAVMLAVGAHVPQPAGVPGEELPGVMQGIDFLRQVSLVTAPDLGRRVLVVGGGNTAVDAARTALRQGAEHVEMVYRRTAAEMTAMPEEIVEAGEEGIEIRYLVSPAAVLAGPDGRIKALRCVRNELGAPDQSGRRRPVPVAGSEFDIEADAVIFATSQSPGTKGLGGQGFGLAIGRGGTIEADPYTLATSRPGVFAAGDAVTGPAMLIDAAGAGRRAAESIARYLRGEDLAAGRTLVADPRSIQHLPVDLAGRPIARRAAETRLAPAERRTRYDEVLAPLSPEQAVAEAKRCMSCGGCSECMQCVAACLPKCIDHTQADEFQTIEVGAVVLSAGAVPANAALRPEFGYGRYPNVVSSMEFERMLSASGPFGGELLRPSDGGHPRRIAFIQCVGSRDSSGRQATEAERQAALARPGGGFFARGEVSCGVEYCSSVCCMYTAKEAVIAQEHVPGLQATVFYMDLRTFGKEFERYVERAQQENGVRYVRAMVSSVKEAPTSRNPRIRYYPPAGPVVDEEFDLVVLAVGLRPPATAMEAARRIGVQLNEYGFVRTSEFNPPATSRPGVFVCGTFREPKDIPETVTDGSAAAAAASRLLAAARGTLVRRREFPPERDVSREAPRVGVIVCKCGRNIASVIDSDGVAAWAAGLPGVVWAESMLYTCAQDSIERIKAAVVQHQLNRVVVASCTPRTHEALFRETIREAGLNPALFEMANIREQSSWVHRDAPRAATAKARDLVAAAVAKARLLQPVQSSFFDLNHRALVVGGGASGLAAALSIAEQGFEVYLVEREAELGGNLRRIHFTLDGGDPQAFLYGLIEKVTAHPLIQVFTQAQVRSSVGYVGNYRTLISRATPQGPAEQELEHGVAVVATGAQPGLPPAAYLYGQHPAVVTQMELDETLARAVRGGQPLAAQTIVMIQCAGSREPARPYCSRVCCSEAIRNALRIKTLNPAAQVYVFYRDIRTYGFKERYYREAREAGVLFVRYEPETKPRVEAGPDGGLILTAPDPVLDGAMLTLRPDLLVLAPPVVPDVDQALTQAFKLPLTADGFFLEAHMKLRPVDFASDGVFLCGLAHGPKLLAESLAQAEAASVRAAAILAAEKLESRGNVARVSERLCRGCGVCVNVCAYDARVLDPDTSVAKVLQVLCQGCGACVAACPSGACEQDGFTKRQIAAMLEAVLGYEAEEADMRPRAEIAPAHAAGPVTQKEVAGP